jgi:hypothetical protein
MHTYWLDRCAVPRASPPQRSPAARCAPTGTGVASALVVTIEEHLDGMVDEHLRDGHMKS